MIRRRLDLWMVLSRAYIFRAALMPCEAQGTSDKALSLALSLTTHWNIRRGGLSPFLLYSQHLEQCLAFTRGSGDTQRC